MKNRIVNVAVQVLPSSTEHDAYHLVDAAIDIIARSGLKHEVCPFETVVEGPYADVMQLVEQVQEACYGSGADSLICNLKIQSKADGDVSIEDKVGKYR
ncbi:MULTISPECIES: thiamine-binding protein [unclassified Carboxylicivirga]|uniref:thiamine-binding protein n=1 Tax=Carboxylicivirga TaxID=1628153 RepID=UPI003D32D4DD